MINDILVLILCAELLGIVYFRMCRPDKAR